MHFNNVSLVGGPGVLSTGNGIRIYEAHEHWLVCPSHVLWRHGRELCTGRQCLRCTLNHRRPPQLWRYTGYLEQQLRHSTGGIRQPRDHVIDRRAAAPSGEHTKADAQDRAAR